MANDTVVETSHERAELSRVTGTVGLACVVGVVVILGVHPFGSTELYDDGGRFLDHVSGFWIVIHLVATLLLFSFPLVLDRWAAGLRTPVGRMLGGWSSTVATLGMAVGAIHLVATDTVSFFAFRDTFEAGDGSESAAISADLLLRLHASTLTAWIMAFWFAVPALVGAALVVERRGPAWWRALAPLAAACQVVALVWFFAERQWTTGSETGAFRLGVTLLLLVVGILAWELRRGAPVGSAAPDASPSTG